ncbi:LamG domain-containing protein [Streptomyces tsukubensis]
MSRRMPRRAALRAAVAATVAAALTGLTGTAPEGAPAAATAATRTAAPTAAPAQTEAQALQAAQQSGRGVEVLGLRTERRDVVANPDGTFTAREYTDPVRTVKNGSWADIDKTLIRHSDGTWSPKAATVGLSLSSGEAGKPFVSLERAGRELSLTWPYGKLPAPTVSGDTATYRDALPGVDLTVRAEADGFGHLLVVKTPEAAADPRLAVLNLGLTTQGLTVKEQASGALKAEDSAVGGTVFEAGKPAMWDSASVTESAAPKGPRPALARSARTAEQPVAPVPAVPGPGGGGRTAPLDVRVGKDTLTLVPDQKLLKGADTVFPVVIDPIQRTTSRSAWTGVMSGMPTEQDWKYADSAGVGKCPTDYNPITCNGVGVRRLLFTMPVSFYKGKQIVSATFSARLAHIYSATPTAEPIRLYRVGGKNHSISSSSNWSNTQNDWAAHLGTVDKAIAPTSCTSDANLHFEGGATGALTNSVRTAANEGWSSMTLGLRAADEGRFPEWKRICGNTYLSVNYNTLPHQIRTADMSSNPGGICSWGAGRPYAEVPPTLSAVAADPDHGSGQTDKVKVQFKVNWTDTAGASQAYTYDTAYLSPVSGTRFTHTVKSTIPQNTTIYWSARSFDGDGWSPWSDEGSAQRCEFVYDRTLPGKPNVVSETYPSDTVYHDGVGAYGTFTFSPNPNDSVPDTDVVKYRYAFDSTATPATTIDAVRAGGPASVTWMPTSAGRHWLDVVAVDRAGNPSTTMHYEFLVSEGAPVAGQWNLAEETASETAHDETGSFSADPGNGVTFGVPGPGGAADSAARLDGTSEAFLDTGAMVVASEDGFSVSAWVRPTDLARDMAVVSQDGTGEPGFTLGYDAVARTWAFSVPVTDVDTLGSWKAVSTGVSVVKDQWVLLTGVYDAQTTDLRLYINKDLRGSAKRGTVWKAYGPLQIGRATAKSGYRNHFTGDLAEVRVFNRVLPPGQVAELMTVKPERKGYWQLDSATSGSSAESGNGMPLALSGDASVYRPKDPLFDLPALVGEGHLILDGDGDYAATSTAPVTGGTSFTVSARAQLTSLDPVKAQTVFSLPGTAANRFVVRYRPPTGTHPSMWELAIADSDSAGAKVKSFTDDQLLPDTDADGQHLAVVYDAFANDIRLYVDGQLAGTAQGADNTLWTASGGLQVGRSAVGSVPEHFAGALDEIRAYQGAADPVAIRRMAVTTALPDM